MCGTVDYVYCLHGVELKEGTFTYNSHDFWYVNEYALLFLLN